ncbi:hydantoinase/carbamoylase family amidase [Natrialba hulunbeirensis JCM 10989]|uniref:Hydantoinase/carbamoylase family amidase n=1 Tax=Natrialba hulunbeirensis JCM 10989 TaxID=1227493 RepID=L9ZR02_9EURY|nr:M20 family metallo-hydrolase [Natrialba hulunbeirensis]ELY87563.1 hydantoinase/carbamoylase family amidase [Natrialba hulunbeirensis JCM 10989]
MDVSQERLRADIEANAAFGALEYDDSKPPNDDDGEGQAQQQRQKHGRTVLTGTEANRRARDHLVERFEDAGLAVEIDAVGNITGTWTPESAEPDAAPVAAGSHLDSVPEGGIFDGPLGVYAALESVRALQDAKAEPERPITVVCFTEEEGTRFGGGLLGSSVATGQLAVEEALAATDADGVQLGDSLADIGYRGEGVLEPADWDSFLELHVEQDTRLEDAGVPVGVVSTITGIAHVTATFTGETNHAGTTGMAERADAFTAASEFALALEETGMEAAVAGASESAGNGDADADADGIDKPVGGTAVATVGKCNVTPNATNVVPGRVELGVDIRDVDGETMAGLLERAEQILARIESERPVETTFELELDVSPAPMSERCRDALESGADATAVDARTLHSGAAHDAMCVSRVTDAGMLFAPSRDGLSHTPLEWTDWDDCATATRVLAKAVGQLAGAASD